MEQFSEVDIDVKYDNISKRFDELASLAEQLESSNELTIDLAMEADKCIPDKGILSTYFSTASKQQKNQIAVESIASGIVDSIKKMYDYVAEMLKNIITWMITFTKSIFSSDEKDVKKIKDVLGDREFNDSLNDVDDLIKSAGRAAIEDMGIGIDEDVVPVKVSDIFDNFKRSLNDHEIDFLTSGKQYTVIRDVVHEFCAGNYPRFINGFSEQLQYWIDESLKEAPHIGKNYDVTQTFVKKRERYLLEIKQRYEGSINTIEQLNKMCSSFHVQGDHSHLSMFQKKPSALFPHIKRIWDTVKFERIGEEDKKLIANLEKIQKQFENNTKLVSIKMEDSERTWPAVQGILRIAHKTNREMLHHITSLVRVGRYIKTSADIFYNTTIKSFNYIIRILNALGKIPTIDKEKVVKCLDTIRMRRKAIDSITNIT